MSLRYNFVTPLTSMVFIKPGAEDGPDSTLIADQLTEGEGGERGFNWAVLSIYSCFQHIYIKLLFFRTAQRQQEEKLGMTGLKNIYFFKYIASKYNPGINSICCIAFSFNFIVPFSRNWLRTHSKICSSTHTHIFR